ncbi:TspO/MBR family protein [Paracidovorax citrulli]|uniref:TspO and MBR-like protein n=2 Tax=Paracidovorax citrulli TaxID=80869 RepID=A1TJ89_PARC0|nr:TspO and MBR-like protein [Paracidovorax citrulli AAC00-1]ATG97057.1 tryptophan-rich sensory protein [Paracidovorax citrulli]PVY65207.1 TspO/MBR related protein [Paracidovorax citrulli]REG70603.1 TspO/MBR related protein [Paracidovorax citrulli]RLJ95155.1 TspO/MBR related protein [Paracidovorax citrulli]
MTSPSTPPSPATASARRAPLSFHTWLALASWLLLCFIAAGTGSVASVQAPQFYAQLVQPPWAPPPGVFGPVWSVLYTLMGIAAWLVWREPAGKARRQALALFCAQLALNALWSWLFFQWHRGAWALADIALLGICVAATFVAFLRLRTLAGLLLLPYLAWISFAGALNYTLWRMNPGLLG